MRRLASAALVCPVIVFALTFARLFAGNNANFQSTILASSVMVLAIHLALVLAILHKAVKNRR